MKFISAYGASFYFRRLLLGGTFNLCQTPASVCLWWLTSTFKIFGWVQLNLWSRLFVQFVTCCSAFVLWSYRSKKAFFDSPKRVNGAFFFSCRWAGPKFKESILIVEEWGDFVLGLLWSYHSDPMVSAFKLKLRTFLWYCLLCCTRWF